MLNEVFASIEHLVARYASVPAKISNSILQTLTVIYQSQFANAQKVKKITGEKLEMREANLIFRFLKEIDRESMENQSDET